MLNSLLCQALSLFINPCIALDPEIESLLTNLNGKTLGINIIDWNITLTFCPDKTSLNITSSLDKADATLTGKLFDLACLGVSNNPQVYLTKGQISLEGSIQILEAYQQFFNALELDWEGFLATFLGDIIAHQLVKTITQFLAVQKKNQQRTLLDITEYLQEEKQLFPPREEVEDFFDDIQDLVDAVDRLERNINH